MDVTNLDGAGEGPPERPALRVIPGGLTAPPPRRATPWRPRLARA